MEKKVDTKISLQALDLGRLTLHIVGDSPLISHAWSQKARLQYLDELMDKPSIGRRSKHPTQEFAGSLYWLSDKPEIDDDTPEDEAQKILAQVLSTARFGFPTSAFKAAAIDAAMRAGVIKKAVARGAFFIYGEFAELKGIPTPREDMVRIGRGNPDIRFRAEFKSWSTTLDIEFNKRLLNAEQLANIFRMGGYACGVGDWRPAKGGSFGMFHIE